MQALKYIVIAGAVVCGLISAWLWARSTRVPMPAPNRPASTGGDVQRMINAMHAASRLSIQAAGYAAFSSILSAFSSLL
ncbi:hypothetical protein FV228_00220 [Methylobacterium sp. WL18]|uniref:hypothetical protein n=1 Tax=Methylobacterium sp. WL18 TaxID=2603897 RepID=UPI0011CB5760|nr:hypothetical protein [Methylobacterium sp. WL18]TXN76613.1 hypothetical protein FV228_00220 [Methylobacterium sp. WL18]